MAELPLLSFMSLNEGQASSKILIRFWFLFSAALWRAVLPSSSCKSSLAPFLIKKITVLSFPKKKKN